MKSIDEQEGEINAQAALVLLKLLSVDTGRIFVKDVRLIRNDYMVDVDVSLTVSNESYDKICEALQAAWAHTRGPIRHY